MAADIPDTVLKIFTAGATREGLAACAARFEAASGIALKAETTHGHLIAELVIAGKTDSDVVMLPAHMIADLAHRGLLSSDPAPVEIGTIRIGGAVRAGAPLPDLSTTTALIAALRAARSIVLTEAPSGKHMDALIDKLGLRDEIGGRIVRFDTGTMVNEHLIVSDAEDEIAFGVATEILFYRDRGVAYAGPIPEDVQMKHVYHAALLKRSGRAEAARKLFAVLASAEAQQAFEKTGVERE